MSSNLNPDDYQKIELVGEGAFGKVYKAQNKQGQLVAIKIIDLETTQDDIEELRKEIHVQLSCNSPYIVQLYGSFILKTELHIVMEYLSGGSIKGYCKTQPLEESMIAVILKDTLQALVYLHHEKRIHRDIKADNILIGSNGEIKLADFGVAGQLTTTMSKRATTCGTPYWMAPEVISQSGYNQKADIWSLGITAIEMAKGVPPNHTLHPMKAMMEIGRNPNPPQLDSTFSRDFRDFVAQCCKRSQMERPTAERLLLHPFIKAAKKNSILIPLVERKHNSSVPKRESVGVEKKDTHTDTVNDQEFEWAFDEKTGTVKNKNSELFFDSNSGTITKKPSMKVFDDSSVVIRDSTVKYNDSSVMVRRDSSYDDSSVIVRNDDSSVVIRNDYDDSSVIVRKDTNLDNLWDDSSVRVKPVSDSTVVIRPSKSSLEDAWDFNDSSVKIQKDASVKFKDIAPLKTKESEIKLSETLGLVLNSVPDSNNQDEIKTAFIEAEQKKTGFTSAFLKKLISKCEQSPNLSIQALTPILSNAKIIQTTPEPQSHPLVDVLYQRWISKGKNQYTF